MLLFSDGRLGASVSLEPRLAAQLAARLSEAVEAHEHQHGALWSEDHVLNGQTTDSRLRWAGNPTPNAAGDALYRLVKNLPLQGFERSFKLQTGQLLDNRFLAGIPTGAIACADVDFIARQMNAPDAFRQSVLGRLGESTYLHFGFEGSAAHDTLKLYLEFPRTPAGPAQDGVAGPLYLGFKWDASDNRRQAVSTYSQPQPAFLHTPARIAAVFGEDHRLASEVAMRIVGLAQTRADASTLALIDVTEDSSPRVSFDINLYAAGLSVGQLLPLVQPLTEHFGIDPGKMTALAARFSVDRAGHLSGGLDRHGQPFLTIYHALAA